MNRRICRLCLASAGAACLLASFVNNVGTTSAQFGKVLGLSSLGESPVGDGANSQERRMMAKANSLQQQNKTQHAKFSNMIPVKNVNLHADYPSKCGKGIAQPHPAAAQYISMVTKDQEKCIVNSPRFNPGTGHGYSTVQQLTDLHVCFYEMLDQWRALTHQHPDKNLKNWVAHGGTAMGAMCHGSINPWDDDIDITLYDCSGLNQLWLEGTHVNDTYPEFDFLEYGVFRRGLTFDPRLITPELILMKGGGVVSWFKLKSVATIQQGVRFESGNVGGIDIECIEPRTIARQTRESKPRRQSGWVDHMKKQKPLNNVMFGPTTIQMIPQSVLDKYIELRYGKKTPCQFPFGNGQDADDYVVGGNKQETSKKKELSDSGDSELQYLSNIRKYAMGKVMELWHIPKAQRNYWLSKAGDGKQNEYTKKIPNLDAVEIDNTIADPAAGKCQISKDRPLKVIGFNAERGTHWDKFASLTYTKEELQNADIIILSEVDIGMARSGNVHTTRHLAMELGMNYAYGLEFVELTRGTEAEQKATDGKRDALSLHGNAILTHCHMADPLVVRDPLHRDYFSSKPNKKNAKGYEIRLGGRMGMFVRISEQAPTLQNGKYEYGPDRPHFVVGSAHKLDQKDKGQQQKMWDYMGFGPVPSNFTIHEDRGMDNVSQGQLGTIVEGDFGRTLCPWMGLVNNDNWRHRTFPSKCSPKVQTGLFRGDNFCSSMNTTRDDIVTAPCYPRESQETLTLSDHAIISIELLSRNA